MPAVIVLLFVMYLNLLNCQLTPAERDRLLADHNQFRCLHDSTALTWSPDLEQSAQAWADRCVTTPGQTPNGENIFAGSTVPQVVSTWYSENTQYVYDVDTGSTTTNSFTQVVWQSSTQLGCGICRGQTGGSLIVVCHYSLRGNRAAVYRTNVSPPTRTLAECPNPISSCSKSCANTGVCTVRNNTEICDCTRTGFEGDTCTVDINECGILMNGRATCLNGGLCTNTLGSYSCDCSNTGFGGATCATPTLITSPTIAVGGDVDADDRSATGAIIVGVLIAAVFLLLLIALAFFLLRIRGINKKMSKRGGSALSSGGMGLRRSNLPSGALAPQTTPQSTTPQAYLIPPQQASTVVAMEEIHLPVRPPSPLQGMSMGYMEYNSRVISPMSPLFGATGGVWGVGLLGSSAPTPPFVGGPTSAIGMGPIGPAVDIGGIMTPVELVSGVMTPISEILSNAPTPIPFHSGGGVGMFPSSSALLLPISSSFLSGMGSPIPPFLPIPTPPSAADTPPLFPAATPSHIISHTDPNIYSIHHHQFSIPSLGSLGRSGTPILMPLEAGTPTVLPPISLPPLLQHTPLMSSLDGVGPLSSGRISPLMPLI